MNPVMLVARREVRERFKAKSFRVATVISVLVVVAAIAIPAVRRGDRPNFDVGVLDAPPTATEAIKGLERGLKMDLRVDSVASLDEGRAQVRSGRLDVLLVGDDEIVTDRAPEAGDANARARLVAAIEGLVRLQRVVDAAGEDANRVLESLRTPVKVTGLRPPESGLRDRFTAFVGVLLILVFLQQYGTWALIGVIEEKSSRVVEVLLAAVRPRQLVAGKVLGVGAVALGQGLLVALSALVAALVTGTNIFEGSARWSVLWTLVWFLLGYALYAWVYAAVGSLSSRQADAQNAAFPLGIPMIVGYISATTLLGGGDPSGFVEVLSYLPPTAPFVMPMLIGVGKVAPWQIAASVGLTVATIALLVRVAGDVYARAILHSGRRLKLLEVLRPAA